MRDPPDSERAALFDAVIAANASIFGRIVQPIDLTAAHTVVDVAGGKRCRWDCCGRPVRIAVGRAHSLSQFP